MFFVPHQNYSRLTIGSVRRDQSWWVWGLYGISDKLGSAVSYLLCYLLDPCNSPLQDGSLFIEEMLAKSLEGSVVLGVGIRESNDALFVLLGSACQEMGCLRNMFWVSW